MKKILTQKEICRLTTNMPKYMPRQIWKNAKPEATAFFQMLFKRKKGMEISSKKSKSCIKFVQQKKRNQNRLNVSVTKRKQKIRRNN